MSEPLDLTPVVSPRRILELYQAKREAVDRTIQEDTGKSDPDGVETAMQLASLHAAMEALEEKAGHPDVLSTTENRVASLLQTYLAERAEEEGKLVELPSLVLEAKFDSADMLRWAGTGLTAFLKKSRRFKWTQANPIPAPLPPPEDGKLRVAVFGDWGTGLYGAKPIARTITDDPARLDLLIHLGDVYYSGSRREVARRLINWWPKRADAVHRTLPGNHEMYSGGRAYYDAIRQAPFSQRASYFCHSYADWLLVGLDTAYADPGIGPCSVGKLHKDQVSWLERIVTMAGNQRIVLFSHHQPFSIIGKESPGKQLVKQLNTLLETKQIFAWYWGHEHRCILYERHPAWGLYGRCAGHGGFPEFRANFGPAGTKPEWKRLESRNGHPGGLLLDGPNNYIEEDPAAYSPHGFLMLEFEGDRLRESVRDPAGNEIHSQTLV